MSRYVLRRLLLAIPTILGVTVLIFIAMRVLPGDPLAMIAGESGAAYALDQEELEAARRSLGLDRPYHEQYLAWMGDVLRGELGTSFWRDTPISELILRRAPITIQIAVMAVVIAWLIGLPIGAFSAIRRNTLPDLLSRTLVILFLAVPSFWLGLMVILFLVSFFTWRPPLGIVYFWDDPWPNIQMTIGPALAIGAGLAALLARITRSSVLEILNEDFVRTARAKGVTERNVVLRHVLRNAMLPILTVSGLAMGGLLGGSVAVERAFLVPGLGLALVDAINQRDWMIIQNLVLLYGITFVLINLSTDLAYSVLDPRIRYE